MLPSCLGSSLLLLRLFLRLSLGGFSSLLLDESITRREELRDRAPPGGRRGLGSGKSRLPELPQELGTQDQVTLLGQETEQGVVLDGGGEFLDPAGQLL